MADSNCHIGTLTWDTHVKFLVDAGDAEKADTILRKVAEQNQMKPMLSSYMTIMDHYAERGDVQKTEKLFHRMRKVGYLPISDSTNHLFRPILKPRLLFMGSTTE